MNKMKFQHQNLANGRWFTLSLAEQLGNVGSEYERAVKWKEKGQKEYFIKAFDRALELLDLTIEDQRWQNHRLNELVRLREVICGELVGGVDYKGSSSNYFMRFAELARTKV